ncbi:MAG TPA: PadR family transcriptional regulator [Longimicrobiales bacterium]|nr:PadR family transcriptional regulator [Longimicrobiales bacterium]
MPRPLGVTSLQILGALRDGEAYGLDILTRTGLASGTIYPTLGRLQKRGLVSSRWEDPRVAEADARPRRRYYTLTREGTEALKEGTARLTRVTSALKRGPEPSGAPGGG